MDICRNLTVVVVYTNDGGGFSYEQLTNISTEINIMLGNLAVKQKIKRKKEDENIEEDMEDKFDLSENSRLEKTEQIEIVDDKLNIDPENSDNQLKLHEPYVERLETLAEI